MQKSALSKKWLFLVIGLVIIALIASYFTDELGIKVVSVLSILAVIAVTLYVVLRLQTPQKGEYAKTKALRKPLKKLRTSNVQEEALDDRIENEEEKAMGTETTIAQGVEQVNKGLQHIESQIKILESQPSNELNHQIEGEIQVVLPELKTLDESIRDELDAMHTELEGISDAIKVVKEDGKKLQELKKKLVRLNRFLTQNKQKLAKEHVEKMQNMVAAGEEFHKELVELVQKSLGIYVQLSNIVAALGQELDVLYKDLKTVVSTLESGSLSTKMQTVLDSRKTLNALMAYVLKRSNQHQQYVALVEEQEQIQHRKNHLLQELSAIEDLQIKEEATEQLEEQETRQAA